MFVLPIEQIIENIKRDEGYRAHAYQCTSGAWTVGYGRNIDKDHGAAGISETEAAYLLENDVGRCVEELRRAYNFFNDQPPRVQAVCVELCFWLGLTRFGKFKKCLSAIESRDYRSAAHELIDSRLHQQIPGRTERLAERLRDAS